MATPLFGSDNKVIDDAYHGTNKECSDKILADKFKLAKDPLSRMGDGVYFFESDETNAKWWAKNKTAGSSGWVVLRASLNTGKCLNLLDTENKKVVREVAQKMWVNGGVKASQSEVLNFIASRLNIDSIRAIYVRESSKPLVLGFRGFFEGVDLIVCMRNVDLISNVRIIAEGSR